MGIVQIQLVDLFTRSVIKKITLRSKPKRPYNSHGRHESYNVQTQNSESEADLRCSGPQCLSCGRSCHCSVQFECPQLTADIPTFDASLPANFSTHQVKGINFALSASRVMDQIPIAARHAGHPQIPSFRREGYLPAATSRRPA